MMKEESKMADGTNRKQSGENTPNPSNNTALSRRNILLAGTSLAAATAINAIDRTQVAQAQQPQQPSGRKPNILIIWGDDVGWWNVSAYNHGMMGYKTPNIDRIAKEGAMLTDWYGQQS
jgi:arylsulfatase